MAAYGRNHNQIKRFLSRVRALDDAQWEEIFRVGSLTNAALGSREYHSLEREMDAYKEFGVEGANRFLKHALDDAGIRQRSAGSADVNANESSLVVDALHGLTRADAMSDTDFSRAYMPFQHIIPVQSLGISSLPKLLHLPETIEGRFASRVVALDASAWSQCMAISGFVDVAVGSEVIDELWDSFTDLALEASSNRALVTNDAMALLQNLGQDHLGQMEGIYKGMARVISRDDWVSVRMEGHRAEVEIMRKLATRALVALSFSGEASERHFATFYAPFGPLIPVASLDP